MLIDPMASSAPCAAQKRCPAGVVVVGGQGLMRGLVFDGRMMSGGHGKQEPVPCGKEHTGHTAQAGGCRLPGMESFVLVGYQREEIVL